MQPRLSAYETAIQNGFLAILERAIRLSTSPIICLTLTTALVFTACDSDDDDDNSVSESVALLDRAAAVGDYVVLVDADSDRVFSIDVSADEEKLASKLQITEDIAPNPYWIEAREGGDSEEVLILSAGRRGVSQRAALTAMTVGNKIKLREYKIDAPFDQLLQSSNGNFAVLYFGEGSNDRLYNLNEIAVVDLEADEDDDEAVVLQTIDTANGGISHVGISPRMTIGKIKRNVAVALSESRVTVVDLDNADRNHTIVSLSGDSNERPIMPEQVEFSANEQEIYVRAGNSNDIFVLTLTYVDKDFLTEVSQVPVGIEPSDMEVYKEAVDDDDDATKLLVVSKGSNEAHIVSRSASDENLTVGVFPQTVSFDLDSEAEQIALFTVADKDDSTNVAVLYKQGSPTISLLDLNDVETNKEQNLSTITLREPVLSVVEFEKNDFALITHQSSQIDVIDLKSRDSVHTIQIDSSLQNAVFDTDHSRFWMVPPNQHFVSYVDLDTGNAGDEAVLLDDPIAQFIVVYDAEKVVAVHEHEVCVQETDDDEDGDNDTDDKAEDDEDEDEDEEEACDTEPISISILDYEEPSRDDLIQFSAFFGD